MQKTNKKHESQRHVFKAVTVFKCTVWQHACLPSASLLRTNLSMFSASDNKMSKCHFADSANLLTVVCFTAYYLCVLTRMKTFYVSGSDAHTLVHICICPSQHTHTNTIVTQAQHTHHHTA